MTPFPTSNQALIKDKFLGDHVFYTLGHFCKTNEYNDIGWLLLTSGESRRYKMLRTSHSQLKLCINDRKFSVYPERIH